MVWSEGRTASCPVQFNYPPVLCYLYKGNTASELGKPGNPISPGFMAGLNKKLFQSDTCKDQCG